MKFIYSTLIWQVFFYFWSAWNCFRDIKSKCNIPLPCGLGIYLFCFVFKSTMLAGSKLPRIYQWKINNLKMLLEIQITDEKSA